jgi:hypothetical protein
MGRLGEGASAVSGCEPYFGYMGARLGAPHRPAIRRALTGSLRVVRNDGLFAAVVRHADGAGHPRRGRLEHVILLTERNVPDGILAVIPWMANLSPACMTGMRTTGHRPCSRVCGSTSCCRPCMHVSYGQGCRDD